MSIKMIDGVFRNALDLKGNILVVLLALANYSDEKGACWPSVPTLAKYARVSERTVRYALRDLQARGYITVYEQRGRGHTNQYLLNLQVLGREKGQDLQVSPPENLQDTTQNLQSATAKPAEYDAKPARAIAAEPSYNRQVEPSVEPSFVSIDSSGEELFSDFLLPPDKDLPPESRTPTLPRRKATQTKPSAKAAQAEAEFYNFFDTFWEHYPKNRNGLKPGKQEAERRARRIAIQERPLLLRAVTNYRLYPTVVDGYVKNPCNFLSNNYWRDYLDPPTSATNVRRNGNGQGAHGPGSWGIGGNAKSRASDESFREEMVRRAGR